MERRSLLHTFAKTLPPLPFLLIIGAILLIPTTLQAQGSAKLNYRSIITKAGLKESILFLSGKECGGRASGTRGLEHARELILHRFRDCGLLPLDGCYTKGFPIDSAIVGRNVVGMIPSARPSGKYIIICAHFDNIGILGGKIYPGADANASGVAALIELVRASGRMYKKGIRPRHNIIFAALDGKEMNMAGSKYLAKNLPCPPEQVLCVVNIDQIGTTLAPPKGYGSNYLLILGRDKISADMASDITYSNYSISRPLQIDYSFYGSPSFLKTFYKLSDHYPFYKLGIPAIMVTCGINNNNYKTTDTEKFIAYNALLSRTEFLFELLWRTAF